MTKVPTLDEDGQLDPDVLPAITVTADDITDATTVGKAVLTATDAAAARTALGAGNGAYDDLTGLPTLGTAAAKDTGTATGNVPLLNGSSTNVLHGNGVWADPSAGALTHQEAVIPSDVAFSATLTTYQTITLGVGTWLITANAYVRGNAGTGSYDIAVIAGTNTPTLTGGLVGTASGAGQGSIGLTFVAAVATSGSTVLLKVQASSGASGSVKATSTVTGTANATGYTAVKIA